jgi:transcriptional regulator with XRE-family HTH domain
VLLKKNEPVKNDSPAEGTFSAPRSYEGMIHENATTRMAALLKQRRLELRVSQRHLADSAGVSPSVVSRAERGGEALLSTWEKLFSGLGERLELDSTRASDDVEGLLVEEGEARRERRYQGLLARFGRRYRNISPA